VGAIRRNLQPVLTHGDMAHGEVINGVELWSHGEAGINIQAPEPGSIAKYVKWTRSNRLFGGLFEDKFDLYYDVYQRSANQPNCST